MPDGRLPTSIDIGVFEGGNSILRRAKVQLADGQTVFLRELTKNSKAPEIESDATVRQQPRQARIEALSKPRIALSVQSIEPSIRFYSELLGLPITKKSATSVTFSDVLAVQSSSEATSHDLLYSGITVYVEVADALAAHDDVHSAGDIHVEKIRDSTSRSINVRLKRDFADYVEADSFGYCI